MTSPEDFESQIRMEMEREIEKNRNICEDKQPLQPSMGHDVANAKEDDVPVGAEMISEEEQIKAEIEERLRRKRQQREARHRDAHGTAVEVHATENKSQAEEEQRRQAEEEQRRQAEQQRRQVEEEQRRRQAEEEQRRRQAEEQRRQAEEEQRRQAEEEQRRQAEEEQRRQAEEQRRQAEEEQRRRQAEEEQRRQAEEEQRRQAEQQRRQAEEEQRRQAEEQRRQAEEEQRRRQAEEEQRRRQAEQQRRQAEEEQRRQAEEQRRQAEEEQRRRQAEEEQRRRQAEQQRRQAEEEQRRQAEEEQRRQADEQRRQAEEEQRRRQAEQQRRQAEEEQRRQAEEEQRRRQAEQQRRQAEEEQQRQAEEEQRRQAEEQRRQAEEEQRRQAEEQRRQAEEEQQRQAEEQRRQAEEEQRRRQAEQQRRQAEEEQQRQAVKHVDPSATPSSPDRTNTSTNDLTSIPNSTSHGNEVTSTNTMALAGIDSHHHAPTDTLGTDDTHTHAQQDAEDEGSSTQPSAAPYSSSQLELQRNDNGILALLDESEERQLSNWLDGHGTSEAETHSSLETFEDALAAEWAARGLAAEDDQRAHVQMQHYDTVREAGKCLAPPEWIESHVNHTPAAHGERGDDHSDAVNDAVPTHVQMQLGFFSAQQTILSTTHQNPSATRAQLANRECACVGAERSLSDLTCYFESHVLRDASLTVDDEDYPHNAASERLVRREDVLRGGEFAVSKAVSSIAYGDPIQVCEHVHEHASATEVTANNNTNNNNSNSNPHNLNQYGMTPTTVMSLSSSTGHAFPEQGNPHPGSLSGDPRESRSGSASVVATATRKPILPSTLGQMWVSGVDTRKPVAAMRTFTGGRILCVTAEQVSSEVVREHGEGVDPFIVSGAFYALMEERSVKVSETFYFDSSLDVFYPHKERGSLARSNRIVTFVPNEFVSSLYLLVRVFRPCMDDFDTYVDLYNRADRYKSSHIAPMKQNSLLYAHSSDVMEEMGWTAKSCVDFMSSTGSKGGINWDESGTSNAHGGGSSSRTDHHTDMHQVPGLSMQTSRSISGLNGVDPMPLIVSMRKLYSKSMHDTQLLHAIKDKRLLNTVKTIPINIQFSLQDITDHEVSFPHNGPYPLPQENETQIRLLNTNTPGAQAQVYRYAPCCIPLLNSGYFMSYQNVFYLRLVSMHLSSSASSNSVLRTLPKSYHALSVSFCIKEHDDNLNDDDALSCIYGRYFDSAVMQTHGWSASVHNSHEFALSDEFKIQLPLNLTARHHIFFTLYAVCIKPTVPGDNQPRAMKVGYAAYPLMVDGVIPVYESLPISFVAVEKAVKASAGGYLVNFPKAPSSALLNNGEAVITAVTQTRSTVNASNRVIASVFRQCPASVAVIRESGDDVLARNGALTHAYLRPNPAAATQSESSVHREVIMPMSNLPLAEILAFYPFLCSYAFALIASPSASVGMANRMYMLDVLLLITTKVQQYDSSVHTMKRRHALDGGNSSLVERLVRTSAGSVLYYFLTNDLLYDNTQYHSARGAKKSHRENTRNDAAAGAHTTTPFRLYAGLAETWLAHLNYIAACRASSSSNNNNNNNNNNNANDGESSRRSSVSSRQSSSGATNHNGMMLACTGNRNIEREMNDLSWFLFDAMLRSFYLWNMQHSPTDHDNNSGDDGAAAAHSSSRKVIDRSFYHTVANLCVLVLRMLSTYDESTLVRRVALFTRNLMRYGDRGSVLYIYDCIVRYFEQEGNYESMTNYLRYVLEDTEVVYLLMPSEQAQEPLYLTEILTRAFAALLVHPNRETRVIAAAVMYNFLRRLTDDPAVPSRALRGLASQLFVLVVRTAPKCRALMPTSAGQDRKPDWIALHDRRELTMVVLWILYYTPRPRIRAWMRTETNESALVGVMQLLSDGQVPFRYPGALASAVVATPLAQGTEEAKHSASVGNSISNTQNSTSGVNDTRKNHGGGASSSNSPSSGSLMESSSRLRADSVNESRVLPAAEDRSRRHTALTSTGVRDWGSRLATFVTAVGVEMCSLFLHNLPPAMLRSVAEDRPRACVLPYFILLESVLHLGNSTASLQMAATLLHETVRELLPEIASRQALMSGGVMLLTIRLMSSCCQHVRVLAGWTHLLMCQAYYTWTHSLRRVMSLTANALVSVAESRSRDLRLVGRFVEFQLDDVIHGARVEEVNFLAPAPDFDARYRPDEEGEEGSAEMGDVRSALPPSRQHRVARLFTSTQRVIPLSDAVMAAHSGARRGGGEKSAPMAHSVTLRRDAGSTATSVVPLSRRTPVLASNAFSQELRQRASAVLTLFNHVLRLQADDSMRLHEARVAAHMDIVHDLLEQHAVKEALRWLHRIYDLHRRQSHWVEAGMVLVLMAAVGFRATELYYFIHGGQSRGAYLPYGMYGRVFWHDYVRIVPEADRVLPTDALYAMVSEMYVCPDDPCFTVEGQIRTLKEACELFDKAECYEFAVSTVRMVSTYVDAIADYRAAAVVHTAMSSWYKAMAEHSRQPNSRYYLIWARMERREELPVATGTATTTTNTTRAHTRTAPSSPGGWPEWDEEAVGLSALLQGRAIHRVYKMPSDYTLDNFRGYARDYVQSLLGDPSRVVLTEEMTETLPALPEPDSKRKRIAAVHRAANHCLVTVSEVQPYFGKGNSSSPALPLNSTTHPHRSHSVHADGKEENENSGSNNTHTNNDTTSKNAEQSGDGGGADAAGSSTGSGGAFVRMGMSHGVPDVAMVGFDKTMHIANFEHVRHGVRESDWVRSPTQPRALLQHSMTISTYELERPFPSTSTAIAVARTHQVTLDAYETAKEILRSREEGVANATENVSLIVELRRALSVNELPPGGYMKEVIALMSDHDDVMATLRSFAALVRAKLKVCEGLHAMDAYPEEYALVLKAVTDIECCLVSIETSSPPTSTTV